MTSTSVIADKFAEMQAAAITLREMIDDEEEQEYLDDIIDISMDLGQCLVERGVDLDLPEDEED